MQICSCSTFVAQPGYYVFEKKEEVKIIGQSVQTFQS